MSQKNVLIAVIILLILAGAGLLAWYFLQEDGTTNTNVVVNENNAETNENTNTAEGTPEKNTVWIMDGSFNPSVVTVEAGDTVTWVNKDSIKRQVASDPYPTHTDLPELISEALEEGDEYSFTFDEVGTWYYHDSLNPINKGTVIVE